MLFFFFFSLSFSHTYTPCFYLPRIFHVHFIYVGDNWLLSSITTPAFHLFGVFSSLTPRTTRPSISIFIFFFFVSHTHTPLYPQTSTLLPSLFTFLIYTVPILFFALFAILHRHLSCLRNMRSGFWSFYVKWPCWHELVSITQASVSIIMYLNITLMRTVHWRANCCSSWRELLTTTIW